jgi:hypothetical protein
LKDDHAGRSQIKPTVSVYHADREGYTLDSVHPGNQFLVVILRSPANGWTTKNLEILRGVYLELVEKLRMTREGAISGWPIKLV